MAYAIMDDAGLREIPDGTPFTAGDVQYPGNWLALANVDDVAAIGARPIVEPGPVPAGQVTTGSTLTDDGTTVRRMWTLEAAPAAPVPDGPTLSDWRVGLTLWGRIDDVTAKVAALVSASDPATVMLGKIARERLEYANNVFRAQLLQLKDVVGFTAADVDESLWRAHQVTLGDLSGTWPLS